MTELNEIFADASSTAVFVYASAACLMVSVLAALWINGRGERPRTSTRTSTRTSIRHATFAVAAVLLLAAPSVSRAGPLETIVPFECALHDVNVATAQDGTAGAFYKAPVYEACAQSRVVTHR